MFKKSISMASKNWIIVILFFDWLSRSDESCSNPPRTAFAIDSSQSISQQEFDDQRTLVASVVTNFQVGVNTGDFAVALYNTQVHVNITFDEFDSSSKLYTAISSLQAIPSNSGGSDLEQLFNTTFNKTPQLLLMMRKETNESYANEYKVSDGRLKGVKKIAVTFGVKNNFRDISDFYEVLQYSKTSKFEQFSLIKQITDTLCNALVSSSTRNPQHSTASFVKQLVTASPSSDRGETSIVSTSSLSSALSSAANQTLCLVSSGDRTRKPSIVAVTPWKSKTLYSRGPLKTTPPSRIKATATAAASIYEQEPEDFIKSLLKDRDLVINFNWSHIDVDNRTFLQGYFDKAANLLQLGHYLDNFLDRADEVHKSTSVEVLNALERFTAMIGNTIKWRNLSTYHETFLAQNLACHIFVVNISAFEGMEIGFMDHDKSSVNVPRDVFSSMTTNNTNETGLLVSLVFDAFHEFQEPETFENFEGNQSVVSKVVNVFTSPPPISPLPAPVKISMQHIRNGHYTPHCVFWDFVQREEQSRFGKWSTRGCFVFSSIITSTECRCNHMTNYAVLMRTTEQVLDVTDERILPVITYVGCSVSIFGVFLTIITFLSLP